MKEGAVIEIDWAHDAELEALPRISYAVREATTSVAHRLPWTWVLLAVCGAMLLGILALEKVCAQLRERCAAAEAASAQLENAAVRMSREEYESGEFKKANLLIEPVDAMEKGNPEAALMRARALEGMAKFQEAAAIYDSLLDDPSRPGDVDQALLFCKRMASERHTGGEPSHEVLARLQQSLQERGLAGPALALARQLLPEQAPLRECVAPLLRQEQPDAAFNIEPGGEYVDVGVQRLTNSVAGLLRGVKIGSLTLAAADADQLDLAAGLDVQRLCVSRCGLDDVTPLRATGLRSLDASDTEVHDLLPLAGAPLHELDISHTRVDSLRALALCPLEALKLAGTLVADLSPLRSLSLRELDIARTRVSDISALAAMPLATLSVANTRVSDLRPLCGAPLRKLNLANTPVTDLRPLAGLPLEELDLRGCTRLVDITPLSACLRLHTIYLPKGLKVPASLSVLPRLKFLYQ